MEGGISADISVSGEKEIQMMHVGLGSLVKSVLNGKKRFSGNEEGFKAENFTRHINEGGHKKLL